MSLVRYAMRWILASWTVVSLAACAKPPERTQSFVEFVARLDQAEPIRPAALASLFGWQLHCSEPDRTGRVDCNAHDFEIGGVKVDKLDYRRGQLGGILALGPLDGECVALDTFDQRFGPGSDVQGCTDGVTCITRLYRRHWGGLFVAPRWNSNCAHLVILNTDQIWRASESSQHEVGT